MALNETDTNTLRYLAQVVKEETAELERMKKDRDDAIRFALQMGAYPTEITKATGLTRARIYQIKEHK